MTQTYPLVKFVKEENKKDILFSVQNVYITCEKSRFVFEGSIVIFEH